MPTLRMACGLSLMMALSTTPNFAQDADRPRSEADRPDAAWRLANPSPADREAEALAFVREHHPELAKVLQPLKARNPGEYRKAVGEIAMVARTLAEVKARNPKRYERALDAWKAKSRVELLAAQLAGSPSEELRSQLRAAIEAKVDAEIRRQKFELEAAESSAKKLRESLDRLENHRDAVVESRLRALDPKKARNAAKALAAPPAADAGKPKETRP